jgi:ElaB/YqjD/DUF883 family membrane-anchored ribosome-binding protein
MTDIQRTTATTALARDFQNMVSDAQELLTTVAHEGDAKFDAMKIRVQASLDVARQRLDALQANMAESARAVARTTGEYVRENPWRAVGIGAALGALVGCLIARR